MCFIIMFRCSIAVHPDQDEMAALTPEQRDRLVELRQRTASPERHQEENKNKYVEKNKYITDPGGPSTPCTSGQGTTGTAGSWAATQALPAPSSAMPQRGC